MTRCISSHVKATKLRIGCKAKKSIMYHGVDLSAKSYDMAFIGLVRVEGDDDTADVR